MSSLSKRYRSTQPDPANLMPPDLRAMGNVPFSDSHRTRLSAWLSETAWPRGHMEMVELEGYLVALISWPVGISSGAWLPLIWGERGWKIPPGISSRSKFDEFVALNIGFMQELDRELSHQPSKFESSVLRALRGRDQIDGFHRWGRGFMTALTLGAQGLKGRSASAAAAAHTIARVTASSEPFRSREIEEVVSAILALVGQRTSRGPLGPLAVMAASVDGVLRAHGNKSSPSSRSDS